MDIFNTIFPVITAVGAAYMTHRFSMQRMQLQLKYEKKITYFTDFLDEARSRLEYVAYPGDKDKIQIGLSTIKEFTLKGTRASLFLNKEIRKRIDQLTSNFAGYMLDQLDTTNLSKNYFNKMKEEVEELETIFIDELEKS